MKQSLRAAALLLLGMGAIGGRAQAPITGVPTREEVRRSAPLPAAARSARLVVEDETAQPPCPLADDPITLTLTDVRFAGAERAPGVDLGGAWRDYAGRTVPGATLCRIRDAAAAILDRAGYVAGVAIPAQEAAGGRVTLQVVLARLVRIEVDGRQRAARRIAAYLDRLTRAPVFNRRAAERALLLARDLPGYDVHLTLRSAGAAPGEVVGTVRVTRTPLVATASLQNNGSHPIGRWGALLAIQANDVAGLGDRLTLGLFNTLQRREQTVLQGGYDLRLGHRGLTLGTHATYAWTRPDLADGALRSRTLVAGVEAGYPLVRRLGASLRASGGAELIDQELRVDGLVATRDHLRDLYLRLDGDMAAAADDLLDPRGLAPAWRLGGSLEVRHGLNALGASRGCGAAPFYAACATLPTRSRIQADPAAALLRFSGYAEAQLPRGFSIAANPRLQYAFSPLVSYEQYSGGAYTIGRGYDPGAAIGDSGAGTSLELRYGPIGQQRHRLTVQPFALLDAAWTWTREPTPGEVAHGRLLSAGGGLRLFLADRARLDLLAAVPLRRAPYQAERGDTRVLVTLTTRAWP